MRPRDWQRVFEMVKCFSRSECPVIFSALMPEFVKKAREMIKDGMNLELRKQETTRTCDEN